VTVTPHIAKQEVSTYKKPDSIYSKVPISLPGCWCFF